MNENVFQTVITYNTALYQGIDLFADVPNPPSREDRRDAIITALKEERNKADLVCLQEVGRLSHEYLCKTCSFIRSPEYCLIT